MVDPPAERWDVSITTEHLDLTVEDLLKKPLLQFRITDIKQLTSLIKTRSISKRIYLELRWKSIYKQ